MSKSVLTILLICSISFNVAFIGFFVYHQVARPIHPPEHFPRLDKEFPEFRAFFHDKKAKLDPLIRAHKKSRDEMMDYLKSDDFSDQKALQNLNKVIENQTAIELETGKNLIEFRKKVGSEKFRKVFRPKHKKRM